MNNQTAESLGCTLVVTRIAPDDAGHITRSVHELIAAGADLIVTTAGMSVDPDDVTRKALTDAGLSDILYGMPVLPGPITFVGRIANVQVLGVQACALFFKTTVLALIRPRFLDGLRIPRLALPPLRTGCPCV